MEEIRTSCSSSYHPKKLKNSSKIITIKDSQEPKKLRLVKTLKNETSILISNKLREECIKSEKHPKQKEEVVFSSESEDRCKEKATDYNDKPLSVSHKIQFVSILLTSPNGKVKDLLNSKHKNRVDYFGGEGTIGIKIPSNSEFWLPKIKTLPNSCPELDIKVTKKKDNSLDDDAKTDTEYLKRFQEALKCSGLKLERKLTDNLLHICETVDRNWIAVSQENLMSFQGDTGSLRRIFLKDVNCIKVDLDYLSICLVLNSSLSESTIDFLEIILGEPSKTESLITSLLFASSRIDTRMNSGILLTAVPIIELPSMKSTVKSICENDGKAKEIILYSGIAQVETIQSEACINDEFMMQIESQKYKPVDLHFSGNNLKIIPNNNTVDESIEINIKEISSLHRRDMPRPYTLNLAWRSISINLSASNCAIIDELLGRLRLLKDASKVISQQPVHVILTEYFIFLFAVSKSKELLLQTPLLNLIVLLQDDQSCLIASHSKEADESVSNMGPCWRKISFSKEFFRGKFYEILLSVINSHNSPK